MAPWRFGGRFVLAKWQIGPSQNHRRRKGAIALIGRTCDQFGVRALPQPAKRRKRPALLTRSWQGPAESLTAKQRAQRWLWPKQLRSEFPMWAAGLALVLLRLGTGALGRQLLAPTDGAAPGGDPEYFIRVEGLDFVNGCDKFYVAGWNQWEVVEAAAGAPFLSGASIPVNMTGPELVRTLMDQAIKNGLNTMRTWAHAVNPQYALQTAPGCFNEAVFRGLDYVLAEAQKRGLKLILAFTSNWTPVGGIPEYLKWAGASKPVEFYTDSRIKDMYKNFVAAVVNRVNTINGRTYRDDPTVFAWNLVNEPRCNGCPNGTISNWVGEMSAFLKNLDPNHLVTVGEDGFYGCCKAPANPGVQWTEWASDEGQNFIADHSSPNIDFATFHGWVDNWKEVSEEFLQTWVQTHVNDSANVLKKPVLFEEFGKWVNQSADATMDDRNSFFNFAFDLISNLERENTALKGALFWQWYADGQEAPASEGGGRGLYGIYAEDSAFESIRENAAVAKQLSTPIPNCSPAVHKSAPAPAAGDCAPTRVQGQPGTGFEGPQCNIDINECVRGTATCNPNAACVNTQGGYNCVCHWGYDGDGKTCNPNDRALKELQSVYWSGKEGQTLTQACQAGFDVPWPTNGPGYVYDPIGSFSFFSASGNGTFGSRTNVTLYECMAACQMADTCESIVYNDVLESCFLKRGQCPAGNYCPSDLILCNSTNDHGGSFSFPCGYWRSYYRLDMSTQQACANFTPPQFANWTAKPDYSVLQQFEQFSANLAKASGRFNPAVEPVLERQAAGELASLTEATGQPVPAAKQGPSVPLLNANGGVSMGGASVQLLAPNVQASNGP